MLKSIKKKAKKINKNLKVLGVTILTSLNNKSLKEIGHTKNVKQLVLKQADLLKKAEQVNSTLYDWYGTIPTLDDILKITPPLGKTKERIERKLILTNQNTDKFKKLINNYFKDLKAKIAIGNSVHPKIIFLQFTFIK